jgi:5-methyltetrahydropteroyltriglutamate--homocysteine methyltransferase
LLSLAILPVQAMLAARGNDWSALINSYIAVTNRVLRDLPEGLTVAMHLCRGNRGGHWHADGSYDAVAERLFNDLAIRLFLLEYDSPRAGGFAPLRFVPTDKMVVLGLLSTKSDALETKDHLLRRIDQASHHIDPDKLGVSPQCGFASVETGNPITPAQHPDYGPVAGFSTLKTGRRETTFFTNCPGLRLAQPPPHLGDRLGGRADQDHCH